jgi:transposase InsO family protein
MLEQRGEFVRLASSGRIAMSELCRRFGISRQTGYRLLRRFEADGEAGLSDRSRRPHTSPRRVAAGMEAQVLAMREQHPAWGGRKIARRLRDLELAEVPVASTVTEILRRHDRLDPSESARHRPFHRFERSRPNELWQMDFKGHFALDRGRCHPLTVLDDHCRYSLGVRACGDEQDRTVRGELTRLFQRYGLPEMMLADNGSPWGSGHSAARYTALGVWLMQLGIELRHGRPRHPQTQGKEERFHRTLDREVLQHNRFADLAACQAAFDHWRRIYNEERPHEALGLAVPASRYQPSARSLPERLAAAEYAESDEVRRVSSDGYVRFRGRQHKMSQAFAGHHVAIRPTQLDGLWTIYFSRFAVGQIDLRDDKTQMQQPVAHVSEQVSPLSPV